MSKLGNVVRKTFLEALDAYNGNKTIQRLDLSKHAVGDNKITAFECYKLAKKLCEPNNNSVSLSLNHLWFDQGGIKILSDALTHENCQITSLYLNGSNLKDYGLEDLINALPQSKLKFLYINNNGIGNSGAKLIADAIGNKGLSLKEISLNGNGIEIESALMLKEAIQQLPTGHLKISFINNPVPHSFSLYTPLNDNEIYSLHQFKEKYSQLKPEELRDPGEFMHDQKLDGDLPEDVRLVEGLTLSQKEILNLATLQGLYVSSEEDGSNQKKYSTDYSTISLASILNDNTSNFQKGLEEYYNKVTPQMVINAEKKQSNTTQVQPMGQQQVWYEQYCTALYEQHLDEIG